MMSRTEAGAGAYQVPARLHEIETEVRKSRFIAWVAPVTDRAAAMEVVAEARRRYPDARHHCWAYVLGRPGAATNAAMSDDGEPSGTAGKPILNVIEHKGIGDLIVVVTRYFGGIKLGAGGLVRAYAGATEAALSSVDLMTPRPVETVRILCDFSGEQPVRQEVGRHEGSVDSVAYAEQVSMTLTVPEMALSSIESFCASQGMTLVRGLSAEEPEDQ